MKPKSKVKPDPGFPKDTATDLGLTRKFKDVNGKLSDFTVIISKDNLGSIQEAHVGLP